MHDLIISVLIYFYVLACGCSYDGGGTEWDGGGGIKPGGGGGGGGDIVIPFSMTIF